MEQSWVSQTRQRPLLGTKLLCEVLAEMVCNGSIQHAVLLTITRIHWLPQFRAFLAICFSRIWGWLNPRDLSLANSNKAYVHR
ncbi:uncharacterized protein CANTADRAFT_266690 [Suhomyces tanzawaensis NRRL Y-17324]|uniref:Uncharacterized protein n=1 Tax=Suhomyces tanzawaensis NRRL Y-17324 TaxID=984487 RepID=A0A1E4SG93_9ASCO|nr:uncharacterized protein CANTADRAFT_266690 [Suhomyces tanzawaensis NRRL Y-17324]ODV78485.1 hypothetical protein CANTADRAFT_266690 [Suhomyces tanzawaensis NRRL Y-17324]